MDTHTKNPKKEMASQIMTHLPCAKVSGLMYVLPCAYAKVAQFTYTDLPIWHITKEPNLPIWHKNKRAQSTYMDVPKWHITKEHNLSIWHRTKDPNQPIWHITKEPNLPVWAFAYILNTIVW